MKLLIKIYHVAQCYSYYTPSGILGTNSKSQNVNTLEILFLVNQIRSDRYLLINIFFNSLSFISTNFSP